MVRSPYANYLLTQSYTAAMAALGLVGQLRRPDASAFRAHTQRWARGGLRLVQVEVSAEGTARLDPLGSYVLMPNHQSHVDIPTLIVALPSAPGFLAKAELREVPVFGRAMEVGGHVFIDRRSHSDAVAAIEAAASQLAPRRSIVVFPEGTRSRRPEIMPFKKGGFHLARAAGVSIVPIGIRGTAAVMAKHVKEVRPGRVSVHIGAPIDADRVCSLPLDELVAEVRAEIASLAQLPCVDTREGAERP